jgi:sugar lactone lactonase YvrE
MSFLPALYRALPSALVAAVALQSRQAMAQSNYATPYAFGTLAGTSSAGSADGTGAAARFYRPTALAIADGNIYVTDSINCTIRKITPDGVVTTVAGSPGHAGSADGSGAAARFYHPDGIVANPLEPFGLYVSDTSNHTIRWISPQGVVSTFAGSAGQRGSADGAGADARFSAPWGIAYVPPDKLYVADTGNHTIRALTVARPNIPNTTVSTLCGSPGQPGYSDGAPSQVRFRYPTGVAVFGVHLYVADSENALLRRGNVTGRDFYPAATGSRFLRQVAVDATTGTAYVADLGSSVIRLFGSSGAGIFTGSGAGYLDGPRTIALYNSPEGVAVDAAGNVFVADTGNNVIRKIDTAGTVSTFAGLAPASAAVTIDGSGTQARFRSIGGVAVARDGTVFVSDSLSAVIRKITSAGVVSTFAGTVGQSGDTDGPASSARFRSPRGLALDAAGNLYVADAGAPTIRKIAPDGTVSTIAGTSGAVGDADGMGAAARFRSPTGIAVDASGNLFVTDPMNHTIRKITPDRGVTTFAGAAGQAQTRDGALATARLDTPYGIVFDTAGNLLFSQFSNGVIRKIAPAGEVSTLAGRGTIGYVDATGTQAAFHAPGHLALDSTGNIFVADSGNGLVRKVTPAGVVSTVAGLVNAPGSSDGIGDEARFVNPLAVAFDSTGAIYVGDGTAVRKGQQVLAPTITTQPQGHTVNTGNNVTFSVTVTAYPEPTYQWFFNGAAITGATSASYSITGAQSSHAGDYTVTATNPVGNVTSAKATLTVNTPTTPPPSGGGGGGGGGGGAPSAYFLTLVVAALWWNRRRRAGEAG